MHDWTLEKGQGLIKKFERHPHRKPAKGNNGTAYMEYGVNC